MELKINHGDWDDPYRHYGKFYFGFAILATQASEQIMRENIQVRAKG